DPLTTALRQPSASPQADVPEALLTAARSALALPDAATQPPRRVGKFELREELGSGSFGTVYHALDTDLRRDVAGKILRGLAGAGEVERFLREARSAAQLKHPGIVSLYEAGQTADGVC